jgi:hypothetical protein
VVNWGAISDTQFFITLGIHLRGILGSKTARNVYFIMEYGLLNLLGSALYSSLKKSVYFF